MYSPLRSQFNHIHDYLINTNKRVFDAFAMQRNVDDMMVEHSQALDQKNAQIVRANKECADAYRTIERVLSLSLSPFSLHATVS